MTADPEGALLMSPETPTKASSSSDSWLTLDVWAVIIALLLALAVKFDILHNVPW
jgi:hypothetical protein